MANTAQAVSLFDPFESQIYYQGPLGEGLEDNLFFDITELSVTTTPVPLPLPILLLMPVLTALHSFKRRDHQAKL